MAIFPKSGAPGSAMPDGSQARVLQNDGGVTEDEMILRLWRGWTTPQNADRYEELISATIFPGIRARNIAGLEGLELFRPPLEAEVEFMTLMRFASWDAVKAFAGPNWEASVVPPAARAALARFDEKATHYEGRITRPAKD